MPIFTFEGFTAGSLVAMSAAQGAQGTQGSVPEWRLSNMNTATLDILRIEPAELVAPVGIWFEATDIAGFAVSEPADPDGGRAYDPTAHDITYIWDFDDPGQFTAPLNIPTVWNNKGVDYGKKAYHVFDTPGTYVVRLWAIDREGTTGERMVSITVLDPDEVYAGVRTICVSNQGDFTGAPAGAREVTTFAAAQTAYRALGQTGRILIRRGETYEESYSINDQQVNHHVGAFGTGAKPILRPPGGSGTVFSGTFWQQLPLAVTHWGLRFQGEWDAATETGSPHGGSISLTEWHVTDNYHSVIYQCEFDGLNSLAPYDFDGSPFISAIVDCDITNWQNYGIMIFSGGTGRRVAIVGCSVHQKENACKGSPGGVGRIGLDNSHGPLRLSGAQTGVISASDFYSANGWFDANSVQPCLRLFPSGTTNTGGYFINVNRVACEGGSSGVISLDGSFSQVPEEPGNHVFDMLLVVGDYATTDMMKLAYGGTTARNVITIFPGIANQRGIGPQASFTHDHDLSSDANNAAVMNIYNCTTLNLSDQNISEFRSAPNFTNHTAVNNVIHEPNIGEPETPAAPIDLTQTISGFTPRNRGFRASLEKVRTNAISVAPGASFTSAYPFGTGQADFSPSGRHMLKVGSVDSESGGSFYYSYKGQMTLTFNASNITVRNDSADTWTGDVRLALDQDTLKTDSSYGSPASLPLPVPGTNSPALTANGTYLAHTQFGTALRTVPRGAV